MRNSKQALRPSETSLIIQARIENLTPQQVLIRDELVRDGVPAETAYEYVADFDSFMKKFAKWKQTLREKGAPEWFIKHLEERTPPAVAEAYAEEPAGPL